MSVLTLHHNFADQMPGFYVPWEREGFSDPTLIYFNDALAIELGLDPEKLKEEGAQLFSGNVLPEGAQPIAQVYAGHQFGGFSPQLGDGRAAMLGEVVDPQGQAWDLALKGSGRTVFSRGGDGRAAVAPVLREVLISHAMHHLGIPTTRALAAVATGEFVRREQMLPGAVLARTAASHIRVGTFSYFAAKGQAAELKQLMDYSISRHAPDAEKAEIPALALLDATSLKQAQLIAHWMSVGFIHGVMNTDNTTLSGETIDYGPCAFMDRFDPRTVYSSIDRQSRYAYGNQPGIGQWNLSRFAETLLFLVDSEQDKAVELATATLRAYSAHYGAAWLERFGAKIGIQASEEDRPLIQAYLDLLELHKVDFTQGFRRLSAVLRSGDVAVCGLFPSEASFAGWSEVWMERLQGDPDEIADALDRVNPIYIARNHRVEAALTAATGGDLGPFEELMEVLADPFTQREGLEDYEGPAPSEFDAEYQTFCGT